jgi:hypothetical protein
MSLSDSDIENVTMPINAIVVENADGCVIDNSWDGNGIFTPSTECGPADDYTTAFPRS